MRESRRRLAVMTTTGFDAYQIRLLQGIAPVLRAQGIIPLVHTYDPLRPGLCDSLVDLLRNADLCGLIVTNYTSAEQEQELIGLLDELGMPSVHVGISAPDRSYVHGDNQSGMRELLAHLLDECGVRRPVLVRGLAHQPDSMIREQIFRDELAARGLAVDEDLVVVGDFEHDAAYREVRRLVTEGRSFDAVVALNDLSALGALAALTEVGLRVPEDVKLTGFDNEEVAALHWPGLTTVDQDLESQGEAAARQLLAAMAGAPACEVTVPSRMVRRGSTSVGALDPLERAERAITMAQAAQSQLATQNAVISLNRAMIRCRTLDEVVTALSDTHLARLGVQRCFLAIYRSPDGEGAGVPQGTAPTTTAPEGAEQWAELVLDNRGGQRYPTTNDLFRVHRLLPDRLLGEFDDDVLILQPLSVNERSIGYVLFAQIRSGVNVSEVLRVDLSRTISAVFSAQELLDYASNLEQLVAGRTRELETEVLTRRRAERELHAEVLTRRQAEQDLQGEVLTRRRAEEELQRINAQLQRSLMLDGLTRIGNRVAFQEHLDRHWPNRTSDESLTLLMIDVDLFKRYNDHFGHVLGDDALRTVAACLEEAVREPEDLACRYGGEEFAVILPRSDIAAGLAVAERFQELLAAKALPHPASTVAPLVTASVGVATTTSRDRHLPTPADLVKAADQALYRAKAEGRNRVVVADRTERSRDRRPPRPSAVPLPVPRPAAR